jgi:serine/threonine-protein kinase HipA
MVFNVVAVNRDDHTKNFAFLLPRNGPWQLAPAFDVIHTYRPGSEWTARQNMTVNGKTEAITRKDLYAVGERHEVPGYKNVVREVIAAVERWPEFAEASELDEVTTEAVMSDITKFRPL